MFLQIDWATLAFQIVNFLILAAILSKFLFKPILQIIEQRRMEVQSRLDDAAREQSEGKLLKEEYEARIGLADQQRSELLAQARKDAELERDRIIQEGEGYIRSRREQAEKHLKRRGEQAVTDLENEITETALSMSDRMLSEVASAELSQSYVDRFMSKLQGMSGDEKGRLRAAAEEGVTVVSAYPITPYQKQGIVAALDRGDISYEEDRSLLAGVSIRAGDICLDGSLRAQLAEIRARMAVGQRAPSS